MILAMRTDSSCAELHVVSEQGVSVATLQWNAGRELSQDILPKINTMLASASISVDDLSGVVVYSGPGSFTGLRIGSAAGNAYAYGLQLPVVGSNGTNWIKDGTNSIVTSEKIFIPMHPLYGADPHITAPKK